MNTFITIMMVASAIALAIFIKKKKNSSSRKTWNDYNDFYLGEVTARDIPDKLTSREKEYVKNKIVKQKEALKSHNKKRRK